MRITWHNVNRYNRLKTQTSDYVFTTVLSCPTSHIVQLYGAIVLITKFLLERLQRRAMKLILDCDSSVPTKDIYVKLHWLPLRFKLQLNRVTFIHKAIHKLTPDYISSMFTEYVLPRCLRSTSQFSLRIPRARTGMYKQSTAVNGATEYNSLPRDIKDCSTLQSFKRSCKEWLFTEFLSSVCDF